MPMTLTLDLCTKSQISSMKCQSIMVLVDGK